MGLYSLLFMISLFAGWPAILTFLAMVIVPPRWRKLVWLMAFVFATLGYGYLFAGAGNDDQFGFGAFAQMVFWVSITLAIGAASLVNSLRRSRSGLTYVSETELVIPNIVFSVLVGLLIPLYPIYYGFFAYAPGVFLFPFLMLVVAGATYIFFRVERRNNIGGLSAFKVFWGTVAISFTLLIGYALHTGSVVSAEAKRVANGAPYCLENGRRKLTYSWDMTILNLRIYSGIHGLLTVKNGNAFTQYHWSYRWNQFHGNQTDRYSACVRQWEQTGPSADFTP